MAVFSFDPEELEGIAPFEAQQQYLKKFGFVPPPLPEGYSHQVSALNQPYNRITPPPSPSRVPVTQPPTQEQTGFGAPQAAMPANGTGGGERINTLLAKRNNKKRIQPSLVGALAGSVPSAAIAPPSSSSGAAARSFGEASGSKSTSTTGSSATVNGMSGPVHASYSKSMAAVSFGGDGFGQDADRDFAMGDDMNTDVQISAFGMESNSSGRGKRKATDAVDDRVPSKPRTLGGDRPRDTAPAVVREIPGSVMPGGWGAGASSGLGLEGRLEVPRLLTYLKATIEGSEDVFEGRNAEDSGEYIV